MWNSFVLAYRYMTYHRLRTMLLVAAIALTIMLPLSTRWTIERFRAQSLRRAESTPMVVGAKGSSFGLTLHALYFRGDSPPALAYREYQHLNSTKLGKALPILARYRAGGRLIVGVTEDYLTFRNLTLAQGEALERWGDCLVGWRAARELNVRAGDRLLSDPENLLDLSASGPLKLRVRGVLDRTNEADDDVIFCHLETAWILAGIGHGHDAIATPPNIADDQQLKEQPTGAEQDSHAHAAENLERYSEITADSLRSFHFHGRREDYPLTAILVLPDSVRSAALLEGKYLEPEATCQVILPRDVVRELLQVVARVQQLLDAVSLLLGAATMLLMGLVIWLSLRLRAGEIRTLALLGAARWKIAEIMCAELALIMLASSLCALALSLLLVYNLDAMWFVL